MSISRHEIYNKPSGTRHNYAFTLLHSHLHLSETVIRRLTSPLHRAATLLLTVPLVVTMAKEIQELHREVPLSIQPGLQFKFHVLLESSEWRITTLGNAPLQFITNTQKIVDGNGKDFQHPLIKNIWELVLKCTRLGDGGMIAVLVPVDDATGKFDWKAPNATKKNANLWVRVFEVDSACVAEAEAIKADIDMAGKTYAYWKRVQMAVLSEPMALESCSLSWKNALGIVDKEVVEAKEKFAEAHRAWMRPAKII